MGGVGFIHERLLMMIMMVIYLYLLIMLGYIMYSCELIDKYDFILKQAFTVIP